MSGQPKVHLDRGGRARCGRRPGVQVTADKAAVTCQFCLNIMTGVNHGGIQPLDQKPHGTRAAYRRHLRRDGAPVRCESCLQAERRITMDSRDRNNTRRRQRYAAARAAGLSAREASRRKDLRRAA